MSSKKKEHKVLEIKPSQKKLSIRESISRLQSLLTQEMANGNKRAVDSIRRVIEALERKDKES